MSNHSPSGQFDERGLTRRGLLIRGARGLLACGCLPTALCGCRGRGPATGTRPPGGGAGAGSGSAEREYLDAAIRAGRCLTACRIKTDAGVAWPVDPAHPDVVKTDLYSGIAGVVLFLLELHRVTGEACYLHDALRGADSLVAQLPSSPPIEPGLYTGVAGQGFTLEEVYRASGERKYRAAAERCVELLRRSAKPVAGGVEWSSTTDIISGTAGIGLFLLYAFGRTRNLACHDLAVRAGRRLMELGQPGGPRLQTWGLDSEAGRVPVPESCPHLQRRWATRLKWAMDPARPQIMMPNFSHGTAGICYFLATLYRACSGRAPYRPYYPCSGRAPYRPYYQTKDQGFLDSALAGARYLQRVAKTDGDTCLILHHEQGGEDLFYLGWCHGPAGTGRLFYRLWQVTQGEQWMSWLRKSAGAVMQSGIPERRTPGFWNNVGQCCGSAGVAEFFLDLHRVTGQPEYLRFCKRITADLLRRAQPEDDGLKWVHAEHRVQPDLLAAQTGYMQGAAGIGMLLLHLDALEHGRQWAIALPDSPFGNA